MRHSRDDAMSIARVIQSEAGYWMFELCTPDKSVSVRVRVQLEFIIQNFCIYVNHSAPMKLYELRSRINSIRPVTG